MSPPLLELTGWVYLVIALLLGARFLYQSVRFAISRSHASARATMLASVLYLPLVLGALVGDAVLSGLLT